MDRVLQAAKELKGAESPAALARLLNVSDQVITNWKSRGIPREKLLNIADAIGCNVYWLRDGTGLMKVVYAQDREQEILLESMQKMSKEDERYLVKIGISFAKQDKESPSSATQ